MNIPVATVGRINEAWIAEELIEDGAADICMMGRANLCDAEFCNKAAAGNADDIRPLHWLSALPERHYVWQAHLLHRQSGRGARRGRLRACRYAQERAGRGRWSRRYGGGLHCCQARAPRGACGQAGRTGRRDAHRGCSAGKAGAYARDQVSVSPPGRSGRNVRLWYRAIC